MKTAMQELLEEVISERQSSINVDFREALDFVKSAIEQDYLDKEKEQIKDAHIYGQGLFNDYPHAQWAKAEHYYNETYNKQ
jgi:predicted Ser/Thr protein kinase